MPQVQPGAAVPHPKGAHAMAKRRKPHEKELKAWWKALAPADRRLFKALILIAQIVGGKPPRYHELPAHLDRALRKADRNTLFSIIGECLCRLLNSSVLERVKRIHRRRKRLAASKATKTAKGGRTGGRRQSK